MSDLLKKIEQTVSYIRQKITHTPDVGIVLGSGLGNFTAELEIELEIPYETIPNFPVSTVQGHKGRLVFGKSGDKHVVVMAGRFHFYEGYAMQEVVFPIRVLKYLGIETLILSNAAGGVNKDFKVGDLMIISDHISQFMENPLVGKNDDALGPRFPDMNEPYSLKLIEKAKAIASELNIHVHDGVYVGVTGPTFETRSEYRMVHAIGGDAVGMSTVPEVIAAVHMGLPVFAMSVITDLGSPENTHAVSHEEVLKAAKEAEPKMTAIVKQLIQVI
ncbi:MAG: purine-nucleoside phosphorylase [Bacteroidota bacterium]|jgi:purine-nucleoside phosphorylase